MIFFLPITRLIQRVHITEATRLLPRKMPPIRVPPPKRPPAPAHHDHPLKLEHRSLQQHLLRDVVRGGVKERDPTADKQLLVRVRPEVPLQVRGAAVVLVVRAVGALPLVATRSCGSRRVRRYVDVATLGGDEF